MKSSSSLQLLHLSCLHSSPSYLGVNIFVKLESLNKKKLQIQHKPIFEEMTKIKQLNMTGETEEKFERWRS